MKGSLWTKNFILITAATALGAFDELAYNSFYPKLIPPGREEQGYAVSATLYPVLRVVMTPAAALLMERLGVGLILLIQAALSLCAAAEFLGRTFGGTVQYRLRLPAEKKFGFAFGVYQFYELMDICLLWLPYPLMLASRACAGFLGANSAAMRQAAVQRYLPDRLRARVNAFEEICMVAASCCLSLVLGALGEVLDHRLCVTLAAGASMLACWLTIWKNRRAVRTVYEARNDRDCKKGASDIILE